MNIPKHNCTLEDVVNFYRNSDVYRRLSSSSQKDYDNHLSATLITEVESDKYLRKAGKRKEVQEGEIFDNQAEWADGFCGK